MDINIELLIVAKLFVSFLLGGFIGYDRERHGRDAGIRTYAAVCIGATLYTSIGSHLPDAGSASRIIANIVVGIGFLGAGIIYRTNSSKGSYGLTTAATIWGTAAIGVATGLGMFVIAVVGSCALYFLLSLHHQKWYVKWKKRLSGNLSGKDNDEVHSGTD